MRRGPKSALVLLLVALATASCGGAEPASGSQKSDTSAPRIASSEVDLKILEKSAEMACSCSRAGGGDETCWKEFNSRKAEINRKLSGSEEGDVDVGVATACAPVSTELECYEFSDGERCVVTGYHANGASTANSDVMVCTKAEAQAIERASQAAFYPDGEFIGYDDEEGWAQANRDSQEAIDRVMAKIRRGESFLESDEASEGCV